jgi:hypothetical protein
LYFLDPGEVAERIRSDKALGVKLELTGTPVFFLGVVRKDGSIDLKRRLNGMITASELATEILNMN